jgi:hypothetical protein
MLGVGFWKGAGIPRGVRSNILVECGCCSCYHRDDFEGDCREDSERFASPEDFEERTGLECEDVVTLEGQEQD